MKKILSIIAFLLVSFAGFSQTKGISYQAVIIDPNPIQIPGSDITAQPYVSKDVWIRFGIYAGTTLQYEELHKTKTDEFGLVNLIIGAGVNTGKAGTFTSLSWDGVTKNIITNVSFDQGGRYTEVSNQKLNYVPYTLLAETAVKLAGVLPIASGGTGATNAIAARTNLGIGNVDNTADMDKPVSTATLAILDVKESLANKSTNIIADSASSVKYPSVKAIKDYIDSRNAVLAQQANRANLALKATALETPRTINGIAFDGTANITIPVGVTPPDASTTTKGLVQLTGDLTGTAAAPTISASAISTAKIIDGAVTDAKISSVAGSKVTGNIAGNAANVTGMIAVANGGTGATTAAGALTNLGAESVANKSTNLNDDANSTVKYPSVKLIKDYVDLRVAAAGVSDGSITSAKIADGAITTAKVASGAITDAKITSLAGSKITGNIPGNAANVTGTVAIANGGTGATTAAGARTNLGLVIGTDVQAPLIAGTDYVAPNGSAANLINFPILNQNTTGNAATATLATNATNATLSAAATKLAATKNINGVAFDGSSDITVTADANTLTGSTLASNVLNSSLTSVGTITSGVWSGTAIANNKLANSSLTVGSTNIALGATTSALAGLSTVTATNFIGALTGNAATATKLAATKNINGVAFDGSSDITVTADATTLSGIVPISKGGTGSSTKNFVDLTTGQTIAGVKTFSSDAYISGLTIGKGPGSGNYIQNTALGYQALIQNTSGEGNTAVGYGGQYRGTTASGNTSLGFAALSENTTGGGNVALGYQALQKNIGGSNIAIGFNAMYLSQNSNNNIVLGANAMDWSTNGANDNIVLGVNALRFATTAANNIVIGNGIGYNTLPYFTTETKNILIGTGSNIGVAGITNSTAIGYGAVVNASNKIQLGNANITAVNTSGTITAAGFNGPLTGNASTATLANNISATTNTSLTSLANLATVGTITSGTWSATEIAIAKGGTGATTATGALTNLGAEPTVNKSTATDLGNTNPSDALFPSQKAVKAYVDAQTAAAGVADGSITNAKLAGSITSSKLVGTDITTVGTITSGTWSASVIDIAHGGTGSSTVTGAKTNLGLNNVENTALSTWAGSTNLTSVGNLSAIAKTFMFQDLTLGYGTPNGAKIQTDASNKYISFMPAYGVESTRLWPSGNVTIQHAGTYADNGYTLEVKGTTNIVGNTTISGTLSTTGTISSTAGFAGPLTGNASTATKLATSRAINGVSFDGSADITIAADANTLTGTTLASNVVTSSLTSVGTITSGVWSGTAIAIANGGTGSTTKNFVDLTTAQTIAGDKTFSKDLTVNGIKIGQGAGQIATNTAVGKDALIGNTSGTGNTAIGTSALQTASTGVDNTAFGYNALLGNTTGSNNVGIGVVAGANNTTGEYNVSIGKQAMQQNTSGSANIAVGPGTIDYMTSGNYNTVVGSFAGRYFGSGMSNNMTTMSNSILVGYDTRPKLNNGSNEIVIGNNAIGNGSNTVTIGGPSISGTYFTGDINLTGNVNGGTWSGTTIGIAKGGTGATTAAAARTNLGLVIGTDVMSANFTTTLTGDVTGSGSGSFATTLANSGVSSGTYGSSTAIPTFTVDTKGRLTTAGSASIIADAGTLSGTALASNVVTSSLTSVGTITSGVWSGTAIANNKLANSALTIGSTNVALGATTTALAGLSTVTATNFTGALTGNVTGDVTGNLTGNAATATKLAATKNINGVAFDGSADITIAANSNTLTGTTLASNVVGSSLTSVGTITTGTWSGSTVDVAHGGTGLTSLTAGYIPFGNGSGAFSSSSNLTWDNTYKKLNGIYFGTGADNNATNLAFGNSSLAVNNGGTYNTAIGNEVLNANTTGSFNSALGWQSLMRNTTGQYNTGSGYFSLINNTTGSMNSAFGMYALPYNTTSDESSAFGYGALMNSTGSKNTAIGKYALSTNTSGSNNTAIGNAADVATSGLTNATAIGYGAVVNASNKIQLGNSSVTSVVTSGTISATGFTGPLTGNASTATKLAATKNINGVAFDGSADITVTADAGTLSGTTLKSTVTGSSLTSVGTITTGTWSASTIDVAHGGTGVTSSTGSGSLVLSTSPTLVTPVLGTPTSVTLTNGTGLPIATGVSGLGSGVAAFLATPSSANLATAMTDETGSGALVFANTPTLVTPVIGAATGTSLSLTGNLSGAAGTFSSTLTAGASTLASAAINGDLTVNTNKFTVAGASGNTVIAGTLGVTGATTLTGATTISNTTPSISTTSGALQVSGGVGIAGAIYAGSIQSTPVGSTTASTGAFTTLAASGATTLSGTLAVGGTGTFSSTLTAGASTLASASITGATSVGGTLGVTGATTLSGTSSHAGAATFSSTVNVTGVTTLTSLTASGTSTLTSLTTTGAATFSSTVTIPTGAGLNKVLTSDANGGATWNSNPNAAFKLVTIATYTVSATDDKYVVYTNAGAGTISLPAITSTMSGKEIIVKNISNFNVTISANGSQKIVADFATNAATSATLGVEASNNWVKLIADGQNSQWILFRALF